MEMYLAVRSLVHGTPVAQLALVVPMAIGLLYASRPDGTLHLDRCGLAS
jgi:hypothetical protein